MEGEKKQQFPQDFYGSLLFVLFRMLYIFLTVCQLLLYFLLAEKRKMEPNNRSNFRRENETYMTAMLRPLNSFYLLVWSQVPAQFSNSVRNYGCSITRGAPLHGESQSKWRMKGVIKQPCQSHLKKPEENFYWIPSYVPIIAFHTKLIFNVFKKCIRQLRWRA